MSKLSPYRKINHNYKPQFSPLHSNYNENLRPTEKYKKNVYVPSEYHKKKYGKITDHELNNTTQKRRYDQRNNAQVEDFYEKHQISGNSNIELYRLLEERGKIIKSLEKKLQDQITNQMKTVESIQIEKNKFVQQSQTKFNYYQDQIEQLVRQIEILHKQRYKQNCAKSNELNNFKQKFNNQSMIQMHRIVKNQSIAREASQMERMNMQHMLAIKKNQMQELNLQHKGLAERLKNQIINLNNQIIHTNHRRKIELSQQKLMFETTIDNLSREHRKQQQLLAAQKDMQITKLKKILNDKQNKVNNVQEQQRIIENQQNIRQQELIQKQQKLQSQIQYLEQTHKKQSFQQTQRLKQLNQNQLQALNLGNQAILNSLKIQNKKLIQIIDSKSKQINRLFQEIQDKRAQHAEQTKDLQKIIESAKIKIEEMERDEKQEEEILKVKWAELRQADIKALKGFYEHEIEILNQQVIQKQNEGQNYRNLLHQELREKNQMRKIFDLQILRLNSRIAELQIKLNAQHVDKHESASQMVSQIEVTSSKLIKETKDKEKLNQKNEEQKKKLQGMILAKDKQIQQLNQKLLLLKDHHAEQIAQKNTEIGLNNKSKNDLQVQLNKQKLFYENQLRKRDLTIKNNKKVYDSEVERLKNTHKEDYESTIHELSTAKDNLQIELNKYKTIEKNLITKLNYVQKHKTEQTTVKDNQLQQQKIKFIESKKQNEDKLHNYYKQEMNKLKIQVEDVKQQLSYKEEDLRHMTNKYQKLQQKLGKVLQSQQKLRSMQNKIVELGQDNNLIKNLAEIMKSRKK